ncbi:MAG: hypothetical protein CVV49_13110 [Spirochaetae bacterium HGW-Spirochaetae-5]|nr:MAG: hypothetical protein CVV49_13110 [Spirochaetae bacterium HGW-Spirochaetae-5]
MRIPVQLKLIADIYEFAAYHFFAVLFWLILLVHLILHPSLFYSFIYFHNEFVRDYYAILSGQNSEYGIWPGLLSALGHDFLWIIITLTVMIIPLAVIRRLLNPGAKIGERVGEYLFRAIISLLGSFLVGAIITSIIIAIFLAFGRFLFSSPVDITLENNVEIVASGIIITDLLLCLIFWSLQGTDQTPDQEKKKGVSKAASIAFRSRRSTIGALVLAVLIVVIVIEMVPARVKLVLPGTSSPTTLYSYDLFNGKVSDKINEEGPQIFRIESVFRNPQYLSDNRLYHKPEAFDMAYRDLFIYNEQLPLYSMFNGFFSRRPDAISLDAAQFAMTVTYRAIDVYDKYGYIYPVSLEFHQQEYRAKVTGTDGPGGVFVTGSYVSRDSGTFRRITLDLVKASGKSAWGAMTVDKESRLLFYHSVNGKRYTCSYLSKEQPVELVSYDKDSIINSLTFVDEFYGYTVFIDDTPVFYFDSDMERMQLLLIHKEGIAAGDSADFRIKVSKAQKAY